jgi:ATP-binding cassette subfamily C (CFTR/MRP) protein 1
MQEIVDLEFRDCTVLAVMHRLRHVARYDKVAILDAGKLLDYGVPVSLMEGNARFSELCHLNAN